MELKFGKLAPRHDDRTLMFSNYITPSLPPVLPAYTNIERVKKGTKLTDITKIYPMDGNDKYGCCGFAGAAHKTTTYHGLVNKKKIPTASAVVKEYFKFTGNQDSGVVLLDALNYWRKTGIFGEKILGFVKINPKNHDHIKLAIQLFGGVYLGFNVQENAIKDFQNRIPWTPGKLTGNGHCVTGEDFDQNYLNILTWGNDIEATWAWVDYCVDECWCILHQEAKTPGFAPGYNIDQLLTDLQAITN
jgi:hypothetical protein